MAKLKATGEVGGNPTESETATASEKVDGQEKVIPSENVDEKARAKSAQEIPERFIYIGPSLPGGLLKKNSVFIGDRNEVENNLRNAIDKCPQIKRLLVPISNLASSKRMLAAGGNILSKAYAELAAPVRKEE